MCIELKTGEFEPGYAGQLNFYIKAVDSHLRKEEDQRTIGFYYVKIVTSWLQNILSDIIAHRVSEYNNPFMPKSLKSSLPTVEQIEKELQM